MNTHDPMKFTLEANGTIADAIARIEQTRMRDVLIVADGRVVGTLSEGDILRAVGDGASIYSPVTQVMQCTFRYLTKPSLSQAFEIVRAHLITVLPVVDNEMRLRDVITIRDVFNQVALSGDVAQRGSNAKAADGNS